MELKTNGGVISITILLAFHYLISLAIANTQESEVFLLRISVGNVNTSVVTYKLITSEFLETLCKYIYLGL